jgi:uncharacterized protein (DUF2267 family)
MTNTGITTIDRTVEHTMQWVDDVCNELSDPDHAHGWIALRAVLRQLREMIDSDEAVQLAAQLPMLLRGLYFEGWNPLRPVPPLRDRQVFLDLVQADLGSARVDALRAARAVFCVLNRRPDGEAEQARDRLAAPIRELWPEKHPHH